MAAIGYYFFYALNWIITLLPIRVLYIFSDIAFPFLYYVWGYRRETVARNLRNSFPGKTKKELKVIEKKFYHHLCDIFIEVLKFTHLSNRQLMKRMPMTNPEVLEELYKKGKDVIGVLGHYGNWELLSSLPLFTAYQTVSIYKPLQNKYFDRHMHNNRHRNGMILAPMSGIIREVISLRQKNVRAFYAFINDQIPPKGGIKYWAHFLNQDTAFYTGAEKIASKYNMAVVYLRIRKIRRGYYNFTAEILAENAAGLPEHTITNLEIRRLEQIITEQPEYWLWSHRRWKHKREAASE